MLLFNNNLTCSSCGHHVFREEQHVTFHKDIRARVSKEEKMDAFTREYLYVCLKCGAQIENK